MTRADIPNLRTNFKTPEATSEKSEHRVITAADSEPLCPSIRRTFRWLGDLKVVGTRYRFQAQARSDWRTIRMRRLTHLRSRLDPDQRASARDRVSFKIAVPS